MPKGLRGFQKGHKIWLGKKRPFRPLTEDHKNKIRAVAKAKGFGKWTLGKKQSEETKAKKRGANNYFWKGGRFLSKSGYVYVLKPEHPKADSKGYVLEHRLVMEELIGRYLITGEWIHHKNGIKNDNRIENLAIVLPKTHFGEVRCPHCLKDFMIK